MSLPPETIKVKLAFPDPEIKVPKIYKVFRNAILVRIFFGHNFWPLKNTIPKCLFYALNIYCIVIAVSMSMYLIWSLQNIFLSPHLFVLIEYLGNMLFSIFCFKTNNLNLLRNLEFIDIQLNVVSDKYYKRIKKVHNYLALFFVITRILYTCSLCHNYFDSCRENPLAILIANILMAVVDTGQLLSMCTFCFIRYRIKVLRERIMKLAEKPCGILGLSKTNVLTRYFNIYRDILDNAVNASRTISPIILLSLVCSFPKIMSLFYNLTLLRRKGVPIYYMVGMGVEAIQWGLAPCLSGVITESIGSEVDKIKVALLNYHADSDDETLKAEIREFLQYLELRPFKITVYRIIRVDAKLPITLLSICTTYLIVMIQFTSLFE